MIWYVLAVVLGLALIGAVAALVVTERRPRPPRPASASAAVMGREALDVVDAGLRRLTGECVRSGRSLPDLYAVVYSEERLGLLLAGAEAAAPAPWTAEADGERWTISPDNLHRPGPEGEPALPYALTVTVGLDGADRVLVDLSRAAGPVSVAGPAEEVRSLARAVVTETLSSPVGALAEVTLVGSLAGDGLIAARHPADLAAAHRGQSGGGIRQGGFGGPGRAGARSVRRHPDLPADRGQQPDRGTGRGAAPVRRGRLTAPAA